MDVIIHCSDKYVDVMIPTLMNLIIIIYLFIGNNKNLQYIVEQKERRRKEEEMERCLLLKVNSLFSRWRMRTDLFIQYWSISQYVYDHFVFFWFLLHGSPLLKSFKKLGIVLHWCWVTHIHTLKEISHLYVKSLICTFFFSWVI